MAVATCVLVVHLGIETVLPPPSRFEFRHLLHGLEKNRFLGPGIGSGGTRRMGEGKCPGGPSGGICGSSFL